MASLDAARSALVHALDKRKDGSLLSAAYVSLERQRERVGQSSGVLESLVITAETSLKARCH